MSAKGALWGIKYGNDFSVADAAVSGFGATTLATLNNGASMRFVATQALPIYTVRLFWTAVTSPGQVTIRIETDSGGKPSGSLYDANAVLTAQVPALNLQSYTFASPPTTNLTVGTAYHIVVLTTTGGTTQTLRSFVSSNAAYAGYPQILLTAADGTTRSNFAETTSAVPTASLVMSDGSEDAMGMAPFTGVSTSTNLITTAGSTLAAGIKFTTNVTLKVAGVELVPNRTGTPTANPRFRIYDSGNSLVTDADITIQTNNLQTGAAARRNAWYGFTSGNIVTLAPGTYRAFLTGAADTGSSNCWRLNSFPYFNAASAPASFSATQCPNIASPSWTDITDAVPMRLILDDLPTSSGGLSANPLAGFVR